MGDINWLSLVISTLLPTALGFAWYHKALFGNAWMDSIGMTEEKARSGNMAVMMGVGLVMALFLSLFLMANVNGPGQEDTFDTFKHGALHGAFLGILVAAPVMITNGLFEQKSWKNLLINTGYWILTLTLMGGVLDAMNHFPNVAAAS